MTIPTYEDVMLPLLKLSEDGQEHYIRDAYDKIASSLHLTDEERKELLPSGRQSKFENRVGWAKTHLSRAGLLQLTRRRGYFRVTPRGLDVLGQDPPTIDGSFLRQFPEFVQFIQGRNVRDSAKQHKEEQADSTRTPQELLDDGYQSIRVELAQDLLAQVKQCSPAFFERLVVDVLLAMGYGGSRKDAGEAIGRSGDGGIDGYIKEDKLGLDVIYTQAKRWEGKVSSPDIQKFVGGLAGRSTNKGVFITTSEFTSDARDFAERVGQKIILIDGEMLAQLMIDHDVGVSLVDRYELKKIDVDYFDEE